MEQKQDRTTGKEGQQELPATPKGTFQFHMACVINNHSHCNNTSTNISYVLPQRRTNPVSKQEYDALFASVEVRQELANIGRFKHGTDTGLFGWVKTHKNPSKNTLTFQIKDEYEKIVRHVSTTTKRTSTSSRT